MSLISRRSLAGLVFLSLVEVGTPQAHAMLCGIRFLSLPPFADSFFNRIFTKSKKNGIESAKVVPLLEVPSPWGPMVRDQIISIALNLYELAETNGTESIFPIQKGFYDNLLGADQSTRLSQVLLDADGRVYGFALAHLTLGNSGTAVELEKFGVPVDLQGQKVGRRLLLALATQADKLHVTQVQLLVRKGNDSAIAVYERYGFYNATPASARKDPRFNGFRFVVSTTTLLEKLRSAE